MKRYALIVVSCITLLYSCGGGLEAQVEALAEKECECDGMKGDERRECKEEKKKMERKLEVAIDDANLSPSEIEELEQLYDDLEDECDN